MYLVVYEVCTESGRAMSKVVRFFVYLVILYELFRLYSVNWRKTRCFRGMLKDL